MPRKKTDSVVAPAGQLLELATAKLASSGLSLEDARLLRIDPLDRTAVGALGKPFQALHALRFAYLGPDGRPISDLPGGEPYFRVRYLEEPPKGFVEEKAPRYVQPYDTLPVAYLPGNQEDWPGLLASRGALIITEGELKAAKACKEGFPAIGLGGVYGWRSHARGITWLPSLEGINWPRRVVYLCFDSDYRTNPMVCAALHELGTMLHQRGAFVKLVTLPALPELSKTGLDDFLVSSPNAVENFAKLLHIAEPLGLTAPLFTLNDRYVYVRDPGLIVNQQTFAKVTPTAFRDHLESTTEYLAQELTSKGEVSRQPVSAAAAWLKWPLRQEVLKLTYDPGKERLHQQQFNLWRGWGCEPKKGSVKPFTELLDHLFTGAEPEARRWFERWLACPLQQPGIKMHSSAVLHGIKHGTGKSLIGFTMGRIYGTNYTELNSRDLQKGFNQWAECKQFILGDDVTGSNKREDADILKKFITQPTIRINVKFAPEYEIKDCINYLFTANGPDAFFLEDDDRRFFIHEVRVLPLDREFYKRYIKWLLEEDGAAALFHHLLRLDLKDFDPAGPAFRTEAKERMIAHVRSDLGSWVRELLATPDAVARIGGIAIDKDLFTSKELLAIYDPEGRTGTTANGLARELGRAGCIQVLGGKPVRLPSGSQARFFAVRNPERWQNVTMAGPVVEHLRQSEQGRRPKKF